jgi:hypothetical protein
MTDTAIPDIIQDPGSFDPDAAFWLKAAQSAIRAYCGWHVTPNTRLTGALNCRGGAVIRLPARHITAIASLTGRGGRPIPYACDPDTGLVESTGAPFPIGVAAVSYDIMAGYDECPDVQGVLVTAARRYASTPNGLVRSQSVNGASVSYDPTSLMQEERLRLLPYRLAGLP